MLAEHIASQIYENFAFEPTPAQKNAIERLGGFLCGDAQDRIFILNGYAGTGKTSLIAALVKTLSGLRVRTILLAPTGRAAKVMSRYAGAKAYTIHKKIYRQKSLASEDVSFSLDYNKEKGAVFIVDEASMLSNYSSDGSIFGSGQLLEDLIAYIRKGCDCRLIVVGDSAQLYAFGCPVLKATVERLRMLAALTPDPATKKLFYTLAIKLLADRTDEWYRCFFYNLRMEMEGYFNAQLIMNLAEVSTIEVEGYDYEANEE